MKLSSLNSKNSLIFFKKKKKNSDTSKWNSPAPNPKKQKRITLIIFFILFPSKLFVIFQDGTF